MSNIIKKAILIIILLSIITILATGIVLATNEYQQSGQCNTECIEKYQYVGGCCSRVNQNQDCCRTYLPNQRCCGISY